MATFTERNGNTRAQIRMRGQEASATFDTRLEAEQWAEQIEARIKRGEIIRHDEFGENPKVSAIIDKYLKEVSPTKGSYKFERIAGLRFLRHDTFQKRVSNFTASDLRAWRDARLNGDASLKITKVSSPSVLREMAFLSAIFTHAIKEWGVALKQNPVSLVTLPKKNPARTRRVTDDDLKKLAEQLDGYDCAHAPQTCREWTMWGVAFAIETAMRRGEFTRVQWKNVHVPERYIYLPKTKNGEAREVPLSKRAVELLKLLPKGEPEDRMFGISTERYTIIFREARVAAGIVGIRAHDCRREAATRVAKKLKKVVGDNDVALLKLSAFTGHKSLAMLKIYFNMSGTEMAHALDALDQ
ncbi:tyrosine-type recombinase/integrase [Burkholderia ubonensis]|uniref:tyrosine-type recombinase/integrase n=1 Tax=Burkholderia ubonensis TaxID=101571 RepID=UPI000AF921A5|nr:site-specific integrase [Burkholderia ubonensis]